ncbi:hypothetical protein MNBD_GAMMA10-1794 [hydrothermal vent metagenome]|uniref:General secretion pathway protein L n=1 Tax=hydrothermal vent metagenome TaxID=652676 RepID=A0A3B0XPJ9_9ZZZZ
MSEFLIIHYKPGQSVPGQQIPDSTLAPYWVMGGDQHPSISLGQSNLGELQSLARGKKVSILIDAHFTTLESVSVPSKNRAKQLLAVPFAMEDLLAEDIDDTHFALGKPSSGKTPNKTSSSTPGSEDTEEVVELDAPPDKATGNKVPVIAIKRSLLQDTLTLFKQHQIYPEMITADSVALPGSASQWCVLLDEDSALIKTDHIQAHSCDRENLPLILQALLKQHGSPDSIAYYYKADDNIAETLLDEMDITLETRPYQTHALEIFAQHINDNPSLNLLQGEFTPKRDSSGWFQPWKATAAVAAIWMVLHLSYAGIATAQLEEKNIALKKQIDKEFKRAIPDARKMSNMQKRVKRRLKDLKAASSGSKNDGFLEILSKVSPVLKNNEKLNINGAVFRNNYIDVDLTAKTLQDIEGVKNQLSEISGINAVLSTSVEKGKVKGRLRLEAKG